MEHRIATLVKHGSAAVSILYLLYFADEILPPRVKSDTAVALYTESSQNDHRFFYVKTQSGITLEISSVTYFDMNSGDHIKISYTPLLNKQKGMSYPSIKKQAEVKSENFNTLRTELLIVMIAGFICTMTAAICQWFELRLTLFFFSLIFAALHWWDLI